MTKPQLPKNPAKPQKDKQTPGTPPDDKPKPCPDDEIYEQGDMATPERDPPYEDGI